MSMKSKQCKCASCAGRSLQVWPPERENQWPDQRLQMLRGSMQLLSHLQLQDQLGASCRRRAFLPSTPGRVPEPKQCAAFLLTSEEESIMYHHSTSRSLEKI